jgi:hypothetical protein
VNAARVEELILENGRVAIRDLSESELYTVVFFKNVDTAKFETVTTQVCDGSAQKICASRPLFPHFRLFNEERDEFVGSRMT